MPLSNICENCYTDCKYCSGSDSDECTECYTGKYLTPNNECKTTCPNNCIEVDSDNTCSICPGSLVPNKPNNKYCITEISNCNEYSNDNNGYCISCLLSLIPNAPHKNYCISAINNCVEYSNDSIGNCVSC